jgi:hypothetical protein
MGMLVISKAYVFFLGGGVKNKRNVANHMQNHREKLGFSHVFHQTLESKFSFQQDNYLKHKAKSTLELLTKLILNVPEWPSYSVDLNRVENIWQDLKMSV